MEPQTKYHLPHSRMTADEAQICIEGIKGGLLNVRHLILRLYEGHGWEVLGYNTWRECVTKEFGQSQAYLYFQLKAAQIERNISTKVENTIPETHLRPLSGLTPPQQQEAWKKAVETAPEGKVTAKLAGTPFLLPWITVARGIRGVGSMGLYQTIGQSKISCPGAFRNTGLL